MSADLHSEEGPRLIEGVDGTIYGIGDRYSRIRLDLVVNTLAVKAFALGKISVFGGNQYRPLLHVRDAAQTIFDNLETRATGIFNLHKENMKISDVAEHVKKAGAQLLRGGAFKPLTFPYRSEKAFELREQGLEILAEARRVVGLPIVTEVMELKYVALVAESADMIQIGARNMQNFPDTCKKV